MSENITSNAPVVQDPDQVEQPPVDSSPPADGKSPGKEKSNFLSKFLKKLGDSGSTASSGSSAGAAIGSAVDSVVTAVENKLDIDFKSIVSTPAQIHKSSFNIVVGEPEAKGATFKHYVFKVTVTPSQGAEYVYRRYREFEWIRTNLVKTYPGVFIPPLPTKNILGSLASIGSDKFETAHRPDIERFINRLAAIPIIVNSPSFQGFINNMGNFEEVMKDFDKKLENRSREELLKLYTDFFPKQMSYALQKNSDQLLLSWLEFLQKGEKTMAETYDSACILASNMNLQVQYLTKFNLLVPFIYSMENAYPHPPPTRVDIAGTCQQWLDCLLHIEAATNTHFLQAFKFDLHDIRAFIELLKFRQDVAAEHTKAVSRAKKWKLTETVVNTEKLKKEKEQDLKREEELQAQLNCMDKLILFEQSQQFWLDKTTSFQQAIANFAKAQLEASKQLAQIFQTLFEKADKM